MSKDKCETCNGNKEKLIIDSQGFRHLIPCPACGGSGEMAEANQVEVKREPCPACQKPEQGLIDESRLTTNPQSMFTGRQYNLNESPECEAELKCGCGGNVKIEPSDNGRGLDSTCFFINCENENCPLHDNDIFYDTESEAISAFRLATNQAKLDAQAAKIKELQAENVKLRLIVFGYYDQFKNDMGICGLNTEAKEILKGGE